MTSRRSNQAREITAFARSIPRISMLLALLGACALDFDIDVDIDVDRWPDIGTGGCPDWACGSNTPLVNNAAVGELNRDGAAGDGGFRILSFQNALGVPLALDIQHGELVGTGLLGVEYRGSALIGGRIILENIADLSLHAINIADFGHVDSWTQPVEQVPVYHLLSVTIDADLLPVGDAEQVCGAVLPAGSSPLAMHYAVLIDGERYDAQTKTVSASGASADGWFNIACNGSALAKMKLLGYDPEYTSTATTAQTTPAQRQATLKMITADYCGSGVSFTVLGEPLRWYNRSGTATPDSSVPPVLSSESIWTDSGALCLDVARLQDDHPDIAADIAAECGAPLPSCAAYLDSWQQHGEWRTENPE
jgi:hypothetical protein